MGLFDFWRRRPVPPPPPTELFLPLFPLNTVLFPGGLLSLKVFEARYLDLAANCLRQHSPFGLCLLAGRPEDEILATHPVGTLATILSADMKQTGILMLTVRGSQRFRILGTRRQTDGLLHASVELLPTPENTTLPPQYQRLLPLLMRIVNDLGPEKMPEPHAYEDPEWVGYRLTEVLPIQNLAKQKLLELDDPLSRLDILVRYLSQRQLLDR